jgi:glutamate 5-kinase
MIQIDGERMIVVMHHLVVVKIGSSSLTTDKGALSQERLKFFVSEIAALHANGTRVILVTSAAVAAGYARLGYRERPKTLYKKSASAAVGQAFLMSKYQEAFAAYELPVAQFLLTRYDLTHRKRMDNVCHTLEELIRCGIIPIINENDPVSIDELKFGDNDKLSALVANLMKAEQLIIITDTDGLYTADPRKDANATRIARVEHFSDELMAIAGGAGSAVGTGGMRSKLEAAHIASRGGVPVFIGRVQSPGDLRLAVQQQGHGTYFTSFMHNLSTKRQWIGYHSIPQGKITVDEGAVHALLAQGKSLLPAGVKQVEGEFHPGDVIEVYSGEQSLIGRGIVNYASWQLLATAGLSSEEVNRRVQVARIEVIHRDEWISLM